MDFFTITLVGSPIEPAAIVTLSRKLRLRLAALVAGAGVLFTLSWLGGLMLAVNP